MDKELMVVLVCPFYCDIFASRFFLQQLFGSLLSGVKSKQQKTNKSR
jgi:hypothetical protein